MKLLSMKGVSINTHFFMLSQSSDLVPKGQVTGSEPHVEHFLLMGQTFSHSRLQTENRLTCNQEVQIQVVCDWRLSLNQSVELLTNYSMYFLFKINQQRFSQKHLFLHFRGNRQKMKKHVIAKTFCNRTTTTTIVLKVPHQVPTYIPNVTVHWLQAQFKQTNFIQTYLLQRE